MQKIIPFLVLFILLFSFKLYSQDFSYSNVSITSVSFSGGNKTIRKDDGTGSYTAPQWLSGSTTKSPVAYVSGVAPVVSAVLTITCDSVPDSVLVRGQASDLIQFPSVRVAVASSATTTHDIIYPATSGSHVFTAGIVRFFKPFSVIWEISFDNGITWRTVGTTENTLYVTRSAPQTETSEFKWFHTVYDLSCRNAENKNLDADIVSSVWSEFTDHVVLNYNGDSLFYYKIMNSPNVTLSTLLKYKDAECYTFAQLFLAAIKIQGVVRTNNYVYITPVGNTVCGYTVNRFLVKTWTFGTPSAAATCTDFPYKNTYTTLFNAQYNAYNFITADVTDSVGIPGSCTANPSSYFNNHQIAKIDGVYYDACYGVTFPALSAIKASAISGWSFRFLNGGTYSCYFSPDISKSDFSESISTY
ncbi:MAG: hypothetical protein PHD97_01565 [Bacteroidales bacterium]|nr:hypothetical protein [Bacteroidales bacterium]